MKRLRNDELKSGQRVYVRYLDVFGTVEMKGNDWVVVRCEHPMPDFIFPITTETDLYQPPLERV